MVRVGVIGYGYWGPNLVRVFQEAEGSQVVAVCDAHTQSLRKAARRCPSVRCYAQAQQLLDDPDVELVVIATPLDTHFELAQAAIEAGKHVLVEKPFTRNSEQAEELIDQARRMGVCLAVDHTFVFTPAVEKIKALIDEGQLGSIYYVDSVRINLGILREEIDVVWDLAPHDLSILDYLLGRAPHRVIATGAGHSESGQVDVAYVHLDYGDCLLANIHLNWLSPVKVRRMILGGSKKMIIFDDLSTNEKVRVYDNSLQTSKATPNGQTGARTDFRVGDIWTPHLPPVEALAKQADHVVDAIRKGAPLRSDGSTGLRVVRVLEACAQSLRDDGRRILIGETPEPRSPARATRQPKDGIPVRSFQEPLQTLIATSWHRLPTGEDTGQKPVPHKIRIPLSRPSLCDSECAAATHVLRSGWVTQGPVTQQFEQAVAQSVGARHAVAVANGTAALEMALRAMGIGPGDEVVVPTLTFIATANVVRHCGATPVFADVCPDSWNLDPDSVEQAVSPRTRVILAVHQFGLPADLDRLHALARRHGCVVVEDAACALGSTYKGRPIGSHSALVCFSFHPRKPITTGEGGMIVTDSAPLADRLRRLRHHGMDQTDWQRHQEPFPQREAYVETGFNYRLSDLASAVGLAQMERLAEFVERRRRLAARYDDVFQRHPFLRPSCTVYDAATNGQSYALVLQDGSPTHRDALIHHLRTMGIGAKTGIACIHREPCYADLSPRVSLGHSERLSEQMLLLPLFPDLTSADQDQVIDAVLGALDGPIQSAVLPNWSDVRNGPAWSGAGSKSVAEGPSPLAGVP